MTLILTQLNCLTIIIAIIGATNPHIAPSSVPIQQLYKWKISNFMYIYVKAPLQVMYGKYSTRGGVKWQIHHEAKPILHLMQDPTLSTVFFRTSWVNGVLTDLLFCVGRISSSSSDGSETWCKIKAIVNLYYPQDYEMKYITKCESSLHNDSKPAMLLCIAINTA